MRKKLYLLFSIFLLVSSNICFGVRANHEKVYQKVWCDENGGETEVILPDKTRIDCMLPDYAIEFDFADKWAESIGQSLYYGYMTNKTPGIVLIMENEEKDCKYFNRVQKVANKYNIRIWTINREYLKKCK